MTGPEVTTASQRPPATPGRRWLMIADIAVKVGLVGLLLIATVFPDLGNLKGKAAGARLVGYSLGAMIVPLVWWLRPAWRRRAGQFPWLGDLLISAPWFADTLGNRLNLFDTVSWFDDWMHFLNWGLLTAGVLVLWSTPRPPRRILVQRALAFGVTSALVWEVLEYYAFIRHSPELQTAYTDTLGDMSLGALGALAAAGVCALAWRGRLTEAPERSADPPG